MATGVRIGVEYRQAELTAPHDAVLLARIPRCRYPAQDTVLFASAALCRTGGGHIVMAPTGPQLVQTHRASGDPLASASATTLATNSWKATPRCGRSEPRAFTPTDPAATSSSPT